MNAPLRPLPTVIGPTENALRSLLAGLLHPSPVAGYEHWVALNAVAAPSGEPTGAIASGLGCSPTHAARLIDDLEAGGLVERRGAGPQISERGGAALTSLRAEVGQVTARLVAGLDDDEIAATRRVLDTVRARAIDELALLPRPGDDARASTAARTSASIAAPTDDSIAASTDDSTAPGRDRPGAGPVDGLRSAGGA